MLDKGKVKLAFSNGLCYNMFTHLERGDIMESVKVASDFIIDKILNPVVESDDTKTVCYFADADRNISAEQLGYFSEVLENGLTDEIEKYNTSELKTEYLPIGLLYDILNLTDIPLNVCPLDMSVSRNNVKVSIGIDKPYKEIYKKENKVLKKII